jgi:hypothetical protein
MNLPDQRGAPPPQPCRGLQSCILGLVNSLGDLSRTSEARYSSSTSMLDKWCGLLQLKASRQKPITGGLEEPKLIEKRYSYTTRPCRRQLSYPIAIANQVAGIFGWRQHGQHNFCGGHGGNPIQYDTCRWHGLVPSLSSLHHEINGVQQARFGCGQD